jgi:hypothetical protein
MAKKSVDAEFSAYKSKGMKAPRPEAYGEASPSKAPSGKGPHAEKKDPHDADMPSGASAEAASMAPKHKGAAHAGAESKSPFTGCNGGEAVDVHAYYHNPLDKAASGKSPDMGGAPGDKSSAGPGKKRPDAKE